MVDVMETVDQRRFTVAEYHLMAEAGIFEPDERVELIRGVVRRMSPRNYAHMVAATGLHQLLVKALAGRAAVFKEDPFLISRTTGRRNPSRNSSSRLLKHPCGTT